MYSVAGPRVPISRETYTGAELQTRSARPGAYDALNLPSREGARIVPRDQARPVTLPPAPRPVPLLHRHAPAPISEFVRVSLPPSYSPRQGSLAHKVMEALRTEGGHLTPDAIAMRFGVKSYHVVALLRTPLTRGELVRHQVGRRGFIALPGYLMPAIAAEPAAAPSAPPTSTTAPAPWPPAQSIAPDTTVDQAQVIATDLARIAASAAGLATAFAQLEAQTLVVAQLMGDSIRSLSLHMSHLAATGR